MGEVEEVVVNVGVGYKVWYLDECCGVGIMFMLVKVGVNFNDWWGFLYEIKV